jgi:hypothetical protein
MYVLGTKMSVSRKVWGALTSVSGGNLLAGPGLLLIAMRLWLEMKPGSVPSRPLVNANKCMHWEGVLKLTAGKKCLVDTLLQTMRGH